MAISITTVGGNAVISANAANPGLIITPTGEVQLGVESAVTSADPSQLVTAQDVIDYVQQGGLPEALTADVSTTQIDIPINARRITVALHDISPVTASRALACNLYTYVYTQQGAASGRGTCTSVGSTSVSWSTLNAGFAITTTAVSLTSVASGIVVFERLPLTSTQTGQGDIYQNWAFTSQVGLSNAATQFISSGVVEISGYQNQPITSLALRVTCQGAAFGAVGSMSVVVEA